jgi:uncharacterized FlgJ-related protein
VFSIFIAIFRDGTTAFCKTPDAKIIIWLSELQIKKLAKKYHLKNTNKQILLTMVDIIPASLILAQAAIESNWGRSR